MSLINDLLRWRYAVAEFADTELDEVALQTVLESTCLTASSYGLQPYRLLIVKDAAVKQALMQGSFGQQKVKHCAALVVFAAVISSPECIVNPYVEALLHHKNSEQAAETEQYLVNKLALMTDDQRVEWAKRQAYIALGTFLLAAAEAKLDCCPMEGIDSGVYDEVLSLSSKGLTTVFAVPVGQRSQADNAQFRKKIRVGFNTLVQPI